MVLWVIVTGWGEESKQPGDTNAHITNHHHRLFAGLIAKMLMPGRDPGGYIVTTLLGIAGAFVAKYLGIALNIYQPGDAVGFLASIVGAVVILALYHLLRRGRAVRP